MSAHLSILFTEFLELYATLYEKDINFKNATGRNNNFSKNITPDIPFTQQNN